MGRTYLGMIVQDIYIDRARWKVRVYHAVDALYTDKICDELSAIGCHGEDLLKAYESLSNGCVNNGITYSNFEHRKTIIVIGVTSDGGEYWNTLDHERNHLLQHIAQACNMDIYGEDISYISGEFIRDVYNSPAKKLLCDCCRKGIKRRFY